MKIKRRLPRFRVRYIPPGRRKAEQLSLGPRQFELLQLLKKQPASRLEMLDLGRPRIALNATSTIRALRQKGFSIHSAWQTAPGDYYPLRYVEYQLKGRVTSTQPEEAKQ